MDEPCQKWKTGGNADMVLLVTGGAGFIGSNFIHQELARKQEEVHIVNLDALTYAGNLSNLDDIAGEPRYRFVHGDIARPTDVERAFAAAEEAFGKRVTAVVNFAAESHVDRSIDDASPFLRTNVVGTQVLLESARRHSTVRFLQVSTDEVYGSLSSTAPASTEDALLLPNSPYAATKASADLLVRSYGQTYGLDIVITRASNNYGPYQFPEKLIPLALSNALSGQPIPIYGDGLNIRDWMHVEDHCRGVGLALRKGRAGEVYNFGTASARTNLDLVKSLLKHVNRPESLLRPVPDRPGHDRRYSLEASKACRELGWEPLIPFEEGLTRTVAWYVDHAKWVKATRSGEYREYYQAMYGDRERWVKAIRAESNMRTLGT